MGLFKKKDKSTGGKPARKGKGLGRRLRELFRGDKDREAFFEDMEDLLIEADMGAKVAVEIVDRLRDSSGRLKEEDDLLDELRRILAESIRSTELTADKDRLNLFLVLGVNGVGKTTTIAKLSQKFRDQGAGDVLFAAGDTFRAAAIDQLKIHGDRLGVRVVHQQPGSDPGAVIFDSIASARKQGENIILADTAGRMHSRGDLVKELQKIDKVIRSNIGDGQYRKILIIDATTGQNGKHQAEVFHDAVGVDAVIMTKYDSTAKGGLVVSISLAPGLPFAYLGHGEKPEDLKPFDPETYIEEILAAD